MSREVAQEFLKKSDVGSFIVRKSSSQPGDYALTLKVTTMKMTNFIIRCVY